MHPERRGDSASKVTAPHTPSLNVVEPRPPTECSDRKPWAVQRRRARFLPSLPVVHPVAARSVSRSGRRRRGNNDKPNPNTPLSDSPLVGSPHAARWRAWPCRRVDDRGPTRLNRQRALPLLGTCHGAHGPVYVRFIESCMSREVRAHRSEHPHDSRRLRRARRKRETRRPAVQLRSAQSG